MYNYYFVNTYMYIILNVYGMLLKLKLNLLHYVVLILIFFIYSTCYDLRFIFMTIKMVLHIKML